MIPRIDYTKEDCFKMLVTPEIAQDWLNHNDNNRKIKEHHLRNIVNDIVSGKWESSAFNTIKFLTDGTLLDGQHRLSAVVAANIPIETWIATGCKKTTHCDDGVVRNVGDRFVCGGLAKKNTCFTDTKCIAVCNYLTDNRRRSDAVAIFNWMSKYTAGMEFIHKIGNFHNGVSFRGAYINAAMFLAFENNVPESVICEWYHILVNGYPTEAKGSIPTIKLRNEIMRAKANKISLGGGQGILGKSFFLKTQYAINCYWKHLDVKNIHEKACFNLPEIEETC